LVVSCAGIQSSSNDVVVSQSLSPASSASEITLNSDEELANIDKLLLQVNRADRKNKKLSSGLLGVGKRLTEQDRKEGLHGERSGLSKMFCGSAVGYPTIEALLGCAEALVLEDAGFDVKVRRMKIASDIYRATLKFAERTNNPLPEVEQQRILDNIKCLDDFVKAPDPNSPSCELVKISLTKAPGIVKPNKTGIVY